MIADPNLNFVFAGRELLRINQPSENQALSRVAHTAPVFFLLAQLLAVFQQRVRYVHRRTQRGLIDASVVNLQIKPKRLASMKDTGDITE